MQSHLFPLYRSHHLPCMFAIPELQIPYTLPCPRIQLPVCNWYRNTCTYEGGFDMCRHIITSLRRMPINALLPTPILRHKPIQRITHIGSNILIPILIHTQSTTRMLYKQMQYPDLILFYLWDLGFNVLGNEVGTPAVGGESYGTL